ncbi:hypothetical protein OsI_05990 [Oryza sativa Indica Group]|uniref:Uncharacterized protein n=2 Tax=Oryza sativa TaxID=4530 RepID=B9F381_ORYSJ|nr:hypothetical protein OsI_05990 [Oryza sativa Indica Group]EEE56378.1 hypothetical protein OsJ_05518 [Oryza sativa Japonica Group]
MCSGSLLSHEMERRNQTKVHALFSSQIPNSSIAQAAAAANPSLATAANPSVALPRRRCEPSNPKPRLRVHPPASTPPRRCRARGVVRSPRSGGGRLRRGGAGPGDKNAVCGARTPQPIPQRSLRFPLDAYAARDLCLLGARSISASLQRAISGCSQATGVGGQVQRRAPRPGSGGHGDVVLVEQQVHACQAALPGALELGAAAWHPASLT